MAVGKFLNRHIGPRNNDLPKMLKTIGVQSIDELIDKTLPESIRLKEHPDFCDAIGEYEYLKYIWKIASKNKVFKSYIGLGYNNTILPPVIQRNILENPSWYTSYTPYQAEISQGRLEALLNFQTVVLDLTAMEIANASLLDEATSAAEAMLMFYNSRSRSKVKNNAKTFLIDEKCFPQTIQVLKTRAEPLGIDLRILPHGEFSFSDDVFGCLLQYPDCDGEINSFESLISAAHEKEAFVTVAADILALCLLVPPGEWGADAVVGSTQRFGIPMGYGGPHAAYFATREKFKRSIPGRIIGVSVDKNGNQALRMALQTREQHIRREKATSNICTAQALLASMASMYAVYHGKEGLVQIAKHVHGSANILSEKLAQLGYKQLNNNYFDTVKIQLPEELTCQEVKDIALEHEINFRYINDKEIGISLDETICEADLNRILEVFAIALLNQYKEVEVIPVQLSMNKQFHRNTDFLNLPVFTRYRSETELMRYIKKLEKKDFSLTHSMISLGSCTMKLNAATQLISLSWPEFNEIHPFVPIDQTEGYQQMIHELSEYLIKITGMDGISFMPNSGAAGEYAGLLVIRKYHRQNGQGHRNVVLIPSSAHGTNPASAVMAGSDVVIIKCDEKGNIDIEDLREKAVANKDRLSAFMVTYPSTHGVFEDKIIEMTTIIHENGGQVYMDGANMNAQVGLTNPAIIGADVCHLNLHKTFAIPHGGGGPGVGPICVMNHLVEFLPTHPIMATGGIQGIEAVSAAPWGSASILTISHAYCKLLGSKGLTEASKHAILNANYLASALNDHYSVLYKGQNGFVAHEMIIDCRKFRSTGISETDIAKRLMDYGFHAPTLSFPVHGTLMIEPTESESLPELDRFIEAMIAIRKEINATVEGTFDEKDNVLKNAPHTALETTSDDWTHPYTRRLAAYPLPWVEDNKFWPSVGRLDDAYGDRNLQCSCAAIEAYL